MTKRDLTRRRQWRTLTGLGVAGAAFPGVFLVLGIVADLIVPKAAMVCPFQPALVAVVPALAAATTGIVGAGAFTGLSLLVSVALFDLKNGVLFDLFNLKAGMDGGGMYTNLHVLYAQLGTLLVVFVASLFPAYLRTRREKMVFELRSIAETVQRAVLPPIPDQQGSVRTAADYLAANTEAQIGGDLYDVDTPYGTRAIIGDVRGKGLSAVASANNLLGAFREAAPHVRSLPELAERFDSAVSRHHERAGLSEEEFVTVTIVSIPPDATFAEAVFCGHPGPLLLHAGNITQVNAIEPGPPLGVGFLSGNGSTVERIPFDVDDVLLLYTDGIIEARDSNGTFYPLQDRSQAWTGADARHLVNLVVRDLDAHTGGNLNDDAAVLAIQRTPHEAPSAGRPDRAGAPVPVGSPL